MKRVLDDEKKNYIRENIGKQDMVDIAKHLGVAHKTVASFARKEGIGASKEQLNALLVAKRTGRTRYTKEQDDYIRAHYLDMPIRKLAREINGSAAGVNRRLEVMGLGVPKEIKRKHWSNNVKANFEILRNKANQPNHTKPQKYKEREKERKRAAAFLAQPIKLKPVDLSGQIPVRIDHKTTVYIRPGQSAEAVIEKYRNRSLAI